jgi:anti-sigma regulatory factor (Ser/Thr protein kinase)
MVVKAKHQSLHCQFPAELTEITAARSFVRLSCMSFEYTDAAFISDLELIMNEAFANIVTHSLPDAKTPASIIIECKKTDEGVALRLFDQGETLVLDTIPSENCNDEEGSGRGLKIIHTIADEIKFTPKNEKVQWNQLQLFKRYNK